MRANVRVSFLYRGVFPPKLRVVPGLACSFAVVSGMLLGSGSDQPGQLRSTATQNVRTVTQSAVPQTKINVSLNIDATKHASDDPAAFRELCSRLQVVSGVQPESLGGNVQEISHNGESRTVPDWFLWAHLNNKCSIKEATGTPPTTVQTYAVHSDGGGAICISNASGVPAVYQLKLKMPKGVFKIERLSFTPRGQTTGISAISQESPPEALWLGALTRLEGADNATQATITKPGELAPGEVAIIRYTDVARDVRLAISDLKDDLHAMASSTPGPAARLRRIINDCESYTIGVTAGSPSTQQKRLGCVHRLILLMSQAESMQRNYQTRHTVNAEPGARTMGTMERAQDALAETSAVLSGLIPQVELVQLKPTPAPTPEVDTHAGTIETIATVSLRNTGLHTVESVKLGMDVSALPDGCICTPEDPAYFGSLKPGQSARAVFTLKLPASLQTAPARFVADVSYLTACAPAHLRPRPW